MASSWRARRKSSPACGPLRIMCRPSLSRSRRAGVGKVPPDVQHWPEKQPRPIPFSACYDTVAQTDCDFSPAQIIYAPFVVRFPSSKSLNEKFSDCRVRPLWHTRRGKRRRTFFGPGCPGPANPWGLSRGRTTRCEGVFTESAATEP